VPRLGVEALAQRLGHLNQSGRGPPLCLGVTSLKPAPDPVCSV